MQQLKTKIKPPFLLDGIQATRRGKVFDYKAEKDTHLEQYFFNMQMRQQMIKMKQDRMSQRNLIHKQSKSFEQTIHQQKQTQVLNQSTSPQHQTNSKVSNIQKVPLVSRSLSKEHFVTFLDSLITTVQNVQQLVNTYFPQEQIDNQISKQQDELISQATKQLNRKLDTNSQGNKKEVENIKTQKNFSKLPQIKKNDNHVSKSYRGRDSQQYQIHNSINNNIINESKTLERNQNIQLQETDNHNFSYQHYESIQNNTIKKTIIDNKPLDQIQNSQQQQKLLLQIRSDQTTQLPSVRSSQQQKSINQYKKLNKDINLVQTKPKQYKYQNTIQLVSQSPEQLKSKSVGTKNQQQKNQSKLDFKKLNSINISKEKSKKNINVQDVSTKKSQQSNIDQSKNQIVQNSQLFLMSQNQQESQTQTQDEEKCKLNGTAYFNIMKEEERKETIGKMIESNEIQREDNQTQQQDYMFIQMIQNQVIQNDLKLLKQQQSNYNTLNNDVQNSSEMLIKFAESIAAQSDEDIVNPLEDSDDQQQDNQGTFLITTLEQNNKQVIEYQKENFEQE